LFSLQAVGDGITRRLGEPFQDFCNLYARGVLSKLKLVSGRICEHRVLLRPVNV